MIDGTDSPHLTNLIQLDVIILSYFSNEWSNNK